MKRLVPAYHVVTTSDSEYSTSTYIVRTYKTLEECDKFMRGVSMYQVVTGYVYEDAQ